MRNVDAWPLDFFQSGVDLFFIINGFVMVIVSRGRFQKFAESKRFLFNRVSRIYPTYWLYYFLTLAVVLVQPGMVNSTHGSSSLLMSFLLLPNDRRCWSVASRFGCRRFRLDGIRGRA